MPKDAISRVLLSAFALTISVSANASLIDDEVRLFRSIDGSSVFIPDPIDLPGVPDQDDTSTVSQGSVEFDLTTLSGTGTYINIGDLDVEAESLRFSFNRAVGFGDSHPFNGWVLTDLDWSGAVGIIVGFEIVDAFGPLPLVTFSDNELRFDYTDTVQQATSFLVVNIETSHHVPEPDSALLAACCAIMCFRMRHRITSR